MYIITFFTECPVESKLTAAPILDCICGIENEFTRSTILTNNVITWIFLICCKMKCFFVLFSSNCGWKLHTLKIKAYSYYDIHLRRSYIFYKLLQKSKHLAKRDKKHKTICFTSIYITMNHYCVHLLSCLFLGNLYFKKYFAWKP